MAQPQQPGDNDLLQAAVGASSKRTDRRAIAAAKEAAKPTMFGKLKAGLNMPNLPPGLDASTSSNSAGATPQSAHDAMLRFRKQRKVVASHVSHSKATSSSGVSHDTRRSGNWRENRRDHHRHHHRHNSGRRDRSGDRDNQYSNSSSRSRSRSRSPRRHRSTAQRNSRHHASSSSGRSGWKKHDTEQAQQQTTPSASLSNWRSAAVTKTKPIANPTPTIHQTQPQRPETSTSTGSAALSNFLYRRKRQTQPATAPTPAPAPAPASSVTSSTVADTYAHINLNVLSAKALKLKAEGKLQVYNKLMAKIAKIKEARETANKPAGAHSVVDELPTIAKTASTIHSTTVHLPEVDLQGRRVNARAKVGAAFGPELPPGNFKRKRNTIDKIDQGKRKGYFNSDISDANRTVQSLLEEERLSTHDMDAAFAKSIMNRGSQYRDVSTDEQFDMADVSMEMYESKSRKVDSKSRKDWEKQRAIQSFNKQEKLLNKCWYCLESSQLAKHMLISLGVKAYLALPTRQRIVDGHCMIVPMQHTTAATSMDENEWEEVQYFQKFLCKMFEKQGRKCLFLETVHSVRKQRHTVIECIPISHELFTEAPMYFRNAILDADEMWSQNKKLIDTAKQGGLQRSVPRNFPYFYVQFGMENGGYAHVIEDESLFQADFGKTVICGMLEEPAQILLRAKREPMANELKRVESFASQWKPFNWTRRLRNGDLAKRVKPDTTKKPIPMPGPGVSEPSASAENPPPSKRLKPDSLPDAHE
jgi:CWF19-like protein 2